MDNKTFYKLRVLKRLHTICAIFAGISPIIASAFFGILSAISPSFAESDISGIVTTGFWFLLLVCGITGLKHTSKAIRKIEPPIISAKDATTSFESFNDFAKQERAIRQPRYKPFPKQESPRRSQSFSAKIYDVDNMTGEEFERFIAELFRHKGYDCQVTSASGDFGIDVIANKNGERIGIQCKRYQNKVSLGAVQEVVAGMNHYHCSRGMVITNSDFQYSAIRLARDNNIELWNRTRLKEEMQTLNIGG